nr:MAG TPA: hypothetical protein [Caudoviricetes sp.]
MKKPSPPLQHRRGLFSSSGERSPLLVLTISRFTLPLQYQDFATRRHSTAFDRPTFDSQKVRKPEKLR